MWTERTWDGYWIAAPGGWSYDRVKAAPWLRRDFYCAVEPECAVVYLCGLGWHELYVNGQKAGNDLLTPVQSQYDRHVLYCRYDVGGLLHAGSNAVTVWLGNGNYNCSTLPESARAPWRDTPKLICDIEIDGKIQVKSDTEWRVHSSPIVFDAMREGEHYDARLELPGFADAGYPVEDWPHAVQAWPAAGRITLQEMEPCRVDRIIPARSCRSFPASEFRERIYDFGENIAGWCRIRVRGIAGTRLTLKYGESVASSGFLQHDVFTHQYPHGFQEDVYILKGGAEEVYEPRFTQHGFQYVQIAMSQPGTEILAIEACFIHTDFPVCGQIATGEPILSRLQDITLRSYLSNYLGIPTDCPHREKNGWTGDAQLACETGLWNFDAIRAYKHYIMTVFDSQRPSGQVAALVPTGGWGYNWGPGPAWDSAIFEIPWRIWLFYGDTELIEHYYPEMKSYLEFCGGMAQNNLIAFGLGDWLHPDPNREVAPVVTSTAYYYADLQKMSVFADLLGRSEDAKRYRTQAQTVRYAFLNEFAGKNGDFADGEWTALGAALYFELAPAQTRRLTEELLVARVRANNHKAEFGILGAKFIPRVLSDAGYVDDAWRLFTQPEMPGWGYWIRQGATTLWEYWDGMASHNHICLGDASAWMYEYLGGIRPDVGSPGFRHFFLQPRFPEAVPDFHARYRSGFGMIESGWRRGREQIHCRFVIPEGASATINLPGEPPREYGAGTVERTVIVHHGRDHETM